MIYFATEILLTLFIFTSVSIVVLAAIEKKLFIEKWLAYNNWWNKKAKFIRAKPNVNLIPKFQIILFFVTLLAGFLLNNFAVVLCAAVALIMPPLFLKWSYKNRLNLLANQIDEMLVSLANSLITIPNFSDALRSVSENLSSPMSDEIIEVLSEVRLGRSMDEALTSFGTRVSVNGLESIIAAAIMGRKTGGDLSRILRETAQTLREIKRLEGVVKTKTSEGRNQALVMGLVPPFLVVVLQQIDPEWLMPMWTDPLGWIFLGVAAILEIAAIALIRKIMAVDI